MTAERPYPPMINEPAPDFSAHTTQGPRTLEDYCGRWLVLFSHPMDFTPICTSEFVAFARAADRFAELGCDLLGLSVDSTMAHLAWLRSIEASFDVQVPFPIVDDSRREIATAYGMIHPQSSDTSTVRTTYLIDPDGIVRATLHYPPTNGRSVEEILRLLEAIQTTATHGVGTPEGWRPGDPVVVSPPTTVEASRAQEADQQLERRDWYYCTRPLDS